MQAPATSQALPLRDIKLPAEPGFWPLAPGWWVLIVLVLAALAMGLYWLYRHRKKQQRWQQIDQQLSAIEFDFSQHKNKQKLLTELSMFLRRFVKYQLHQDSATSLTGSLWMEHLHQLQPGSFTGFEAALTQGIYQANVDYDHQRLLSAIRHFIHSQVMKPQVVTPKEVAHV